MTDTPTTAASYWADQIRADLAARRARECGHGPKCNCCEKETEDA